MTINLDISAYLIIGIFAVFVIAPIIPARSGETYWKCFLIGNAALVLILLAVFAASLFFGALSHVLGLTP
jgi:hypothetical protein